MEAARFRYDLILAIFLFYMPIVTDKVMALYYQNTQVKGDRSLGEPTNRDINMIGSMIYNRRDHCLDLFWVVINVLRYISFSLLLFLFVYTFFFHSPTADWPRPPIVLLNY